MLDLAKAYNTVYNISGVHHEIFRIDLESRIFGEEGENSISCISLFI